MTEVRAPLIEATFAGVVTGVFEGVRAGIAGTLRPSAVLIVASFAALGAIAIAIGLRAGHALGGRMPTVRAWREAFASDEGRTRAAGRVAIVVGAVGAFAWSAFHVAARTHDAFRFHDSGPVALLQTLVIVGLAIGIAAVAIAIDRKAAARLAASRALAGQGGAIACVAVAAIGIAVVPALVVHRATPALSLATPMVASALGVALLVAIAARLGRRRGAGIVAIGLVVAMIAGLVASRLPAGARGRGLVVEQGVIGKLVARALWQLADRDGDGSPSGLVGGADCDDANPRRSPTEVEAVGNGIDDNCNGSDLPSLGERGKPRVATASHPRANVLLVTVDALRADHLGAWGYPRATSPHLDAFAKSATRFSHAYTPGPSTRLALPSILAGRYASTIRFVESPTLATQLGAAGYATAVVSCCANLVGPDDLRGFAEVDRSPDGARLGSPGQANADAVADRASAFLTARATATAPFFLWVHFYDPHHPYATPPGVASFGDSDLDRYDAEIVNVDRGIGRVLATLEARGLATSTIVIVASDHGDEFGEHGIRFHARSLYNQVIHVPLLVRAPGAGSSPRVVATPVSLVDIAPTVFDLVGIETPGNTNGQSLAAALRGGTIAARPVVVELARDRTIDRDMIATIVDGHKVIWDREANDWSVYALADTVDAHDLADDDPELLAKLRATLLDVMDRELGQP